MGYTGSRYEETKGLNTKQVAALIRADIARLSDDRTLPKALKVGVTITTRGTTAITIRIVEAPWQVHGRAFRMNWLVTGQHFDTRSRRSRRYSPLTEVVMARLERIAEEYNFDKSQIETDYFHNRFWLHVRLDDRLTDAQAKRFAEDNAADIADLKVMLASAGLKATQDHIEHAYRAEGVGRRVVDTKAPSGTSGLTWPGLVSRFEPKTAPLSIVGAAKTVAELVVELEEDEPAERERCRWCKGTGRVGGGDECGCDGGFIPVLTPSACKPQPAQSLADLKRAVAAAKAENARLRGAKAVAS